MLLVGMVILQVQSPKMLKFIESSKLPTLLENAMMDLLKLYFFGTDYNAVDHFEPKKVENIQEF